MDATQKLLARKLFKLRVHEAQATEYQRLFEKVMGYRFQEFVPIKPYGNVGDGGNDGYIPSTGTYYQVYAPEAPASSPTIAKAAKKVADDFVLLLEHWQEVRPICAYCFVFNDKYLGSPKPVEDALAVIRKSHNLDARVFLAKHLEAEALQLPDDQVFDVIDTIVSEPVVFPPVDFTVLGEVIGHVMGTKVPVDGDALLKAPDFEEKIQFNGLTKGVAGLLTAGSYQREVVVDFFSKNSEFARQKLRDHIASMYRESLQRISALIADPRERGDLVFFDLRGRMTPPKTESSALASAQEAVTVVIAFYFEACDVFEDPPDASS
jgi:hypothetical protein